MIRETLTLSALIAAVLLVRAVFKNRVPKRMVYTLWLVVLVKLCLPGTLVSLPVLPAEEAAAPVQRVELPAQPLPAQQPAQAVTQPQMPVQQRRLYPLPVPVRSLSGYHSHQPDTVHRSDPVPGF